MISILYRRKATEKRRKQIQFGIFILIGLTIIILLFSSPYWLAFYVGNNGAGDGDTDTDVILTYEEVVPPILNPIVPNPDNDGNIWLVWSSVPHMTYYKIYKFNSDMDRWESFATTTGTSKEVKDLEDGIHKFSIQSIWVHPTQQYSYGSAKWSNVEEIIILIIIDPTPPAPVDPPNAPILKEIVPNPDLDGNILLEWDRVETANRYKIYRSIDLGITWVEIGDTRYYDYVDSNLGDGTYQYKIVASNEIGDSIYSNIKEVIVSQTKIPPEPVIEPEEPEPLITTETLTYIVIIGAIGIGITITIIIIRRRRR